MRRSAISERWVLISENRLESGELELICLHGGLCL